MGPSTLREVSPVGAHDPALAAPAALPEAGRPMADRVEELLATVFPPGVVVAVAAPLTLVEAVGGALLDGGRQLVLPGLATGTIFVVLAARALEEEEEREEDPED